MTNSRIPAVYMRGGTSKGVFFRAEVLPSDPAQRDAVLLRIIGSPDPYCKHIDGMGGATSSTSKVVLVSKSSRSGCDVDYLFGQVAIETPMIDWSGNCGNLTAAVGPFAIEEGLVDPLRDGIVPICLWQANIGKRIIAHVPVSSGKVVEEGDFELDGVAFSGAEISLEFLHPGGGPDTPLLPTRNLVDELTILGDEQIRATLINAGTSAVIVNAADLGLSGTELQSDVNSDAALLARFESIRVSGAVAMGLATNVEEATRCHPSTPKLLIVASPQRYTAVSGKLVRAEAIDLTVRVISMGKLHHAVTGTGAVALGVASALPGSLVHQLMPEKGGRRQVRMGHPSGVIAVGAQVRLEGKYWIAEKAILSRSARRLMEGWVRVPSGF
jgi:probable AcnD-accessory protein PrpF